MSEYFIPLSTLVPKAPSLPVLSWIVPYWDDLVRNVGVRHYEEIWSDQAVVIRGQAVADVTSGIPLGSLELLFGLGDGDQAVVEIELWSDRKTLLQSLAETVQEAAGLGGEVDAGEAVQILLDEGIQDPDDPVLLMDAPPSGFRLVVRGIGARLRLPLAEVQLGELVKDGTGKVIGVKPAAGDQPVDVELPSFTLTLDQETGVCFKLDENLLLDVPPFIHKPTGTGWELDQVKLDTSGTWGAPEILNRPGQDASWKGFSIAAARVFNLDELLWFLPERIEVTDFLYGSDGLSGRFEVSWEETTPAPDDKWDLRSLSMEWDRGRFLGLGAEAVFRVGALHSDLASVGPDGDLVFAISARHNPELSLGGIDDLAWELALRTPAEGDLGLVTLTKTGVLVLEANLFPIVLSILTWDQDPQAAGVAALALACPMVMQASGALAVERLTLDSLAVRYYPQQVQGQTVRFFEAVTDWRIAVSADMDLSSFLGLLPNLHTDKPIQVAIRGLVIRVATSVPAGLDVPRVALDLDHESGISFDVGEQSVLSLGMLGRVAKISAGQWEEGVWLELGLEVDEGKADLAFSVGSIRLWFDQTPELVNVTVGDVGFSLLVPQILYVRGSVELGDVDKIAARGFFVGNGQATTLADHKRRSSYLWDVDVGIVYTELAGVTTLVVNAGVEFSSGIPFAADAALYGLSLLYAQNARPALQGHDMAWWYKDLPPANRVVAGKFEPAPGEHGFGLGVVLGSLAGGGKLWNVKVGGLLLLPGPKFAIVGTGNVMGERPEVGSPAAGAMTVVIFWDGDNDQLWATFDFDYERPAGGGLVKLHVPAELGLTNTQNYLYVGRDKPLERMLRVRFLNLFDLSGYLMLDSDTLTDLAGSGVDVPGFAVAVGMRGHWEVGYRGGRVQAYYYLDVALDAAVGFGEPRTVFGAVFFEGGLVVKVYVGFELHARFQGTYLAAGEKRRVEGEFQVVINLPWPIPDLKASVPITCGDEDVPLEDPPLSVGELTLLPRARLEPRQSRPGTVMEEVPVDPTFSLAFLFPMRNTASELGPFRLSDTDRQTWYVAAGDEIEGLKGYRFTLTGLRLKQRLGPDWNDVTTGPYPAIWVRRPATVKAKGGGELRNSLDLFNYQAPLMTQLMGGSATYTDGLLETWEACPIPVPGQEVCYRFSAQELGPVEPERVVEDPDYPDLVVRTRLETGDGGIVRRGYLLLTTEPAVVTVPMEVPGLDGVERVVRLPLLSGTGDAGENLEDEPYPVAEVLELRLEPVDEIRLDVLAGPNTWVRARFYDGGTLVLEDEGGTPVDYLTPPPGSPLAPGWWPHQQFSHSGRVTRVVLDSWNFSVPRGEPGPPAYLYQVCAVYSADNQVFVDAQSSRDAWVNLWVSLLQQNAGVSGALLLEPGQDYRLDVEVEWAILDGEASNEVKVGTQAKLFFLRTTAEPPASLRGREHSVGDGEEDWDVEMVPAVGTVSHYPSRPAGMIFRDRRLQAILGKFGRKAVVRLVDGQGRSLIESLASLAARAPELPEYQQMWSDFVTSQSCSPDGLETLYSWGLARFTSTLAPAVTYQARILSLDEGVDPVSPPAGFRWADQPVLYEASFRTSYYADLADHLGACQVLDEICDGPPDLVALAADLGGAAAGERVDDELLEQVQVRLRLPPRPPPTPLPPLGSPTAPSPPTPELVRLWWDDAGSYRLVGLLLDSGEPLVRDGGSLRVLASGGVALALLHLRGTTGSRSLLLFPAGAGDPPLGGGFTSPPAGTLTLELEDPYRELDDSPAVEVASLPWELPPSPAFFAPEED